MLENQDHLTQLARERHRQMLTEASHQRRASASPTSSAATPVIRRLAAAITRTRAAAAHASRGNWPGRPPLLSEPATPTRTPGRSH